MKTNRISRPAYAVYSSFALLLLIGLTLPDIRTKSITYKGGTQRIVEDSCNCSSDPSCRYSYGSHCASGTASCIANPCPAEPDPCTCD
ncbi:MAG: hypothetical protein IT260_21160 [Saprospiraceae bacterium]|nr:hypothetical protein [Saprospiraceae bacterium]